MAPTHMVTLLENCRVCPPSSAVVEKSLPLTFFDIPWLNFPPVTCLLFYEFPHSTTHFSETVIPNLKYSLSLTLKHFFPLAGNLLLFPSTNCKLPELHYPDGDSVSLTFAECTNDFNYLTSNYARNADEFYPLIPQLPPVKRITTNPFDSLEAHALFAVQVTLFPNHGISVGFTADHVVGDGRTMHGFKRAWASVAKFGVDVAGGDLPFYDRSVIKYPNGLELDTIAWSQMEHKKSQHQFNLPTNKFRASFVMSRDHIQELKILVSAQRPTLAHVSAFTVVCAYAWSCMAKSRVANEEDVNEDEFEHFAFAADCRALLDPPIPITYFGNCIVACFTMIKRIRLIGKEGFLNAAELIGEAIREKVHTEEGVLKGAETGRLEFKLKKGERIIVGVAGSPKFNYCDVDFGWGKPKKFEVVSIDDTGSMSLHRSKESEGDLEIGVSFPKSQIDAFASIFASGLEIENKT